MPRALTALALLLLVPTPPVVGQSTDCTDCDSQVWAQSVFETDRTRFAARDPDGNGIACEKLPVGAAPGPILTVDAFAPARNLRFPRSGVAFRYGAAS